MNVIQQTKALATLDGRRVDYIEGSECFEYCSVIVNPDTSYERLDYLYSRDVIIKLVKKVIKQKKRDGTLNDFMLRFDGFLQATYPSMGFNWLADAPQLCEALLRTMKLWKR